MLEKNKIREIILNCINELNSGLDSSSRIIITDNPVIFGSHSPLDSLGLVNLIVAIEESLEDEHDISIVLANEKAMSQRNSPFKDVDTLSEYIKNEIENE
mgnify:CR=1 FL=1